MENLTDTFGHSPIVWWILAAEAAFWVLLLGGLAARYLARWTRLSNILLLAVPLVDVVLIALTALDLSTGAEPNFSHVLAALYLGFTVGFGHAVIRRVDGWFAHRFAGVERPPRPAKRGRERVRQMWQEWGRVVIAWAVSSAGIAVLALVSGTPLPSSPAAVWDAPLWSVIARFGAVVAAWFVLGPIYSVVFESRESSDPDPDDASTRRHRAASESSSGHADGR